MNKLVRVQSIANRDDEKELANALLLLPQKAIETLVRDEKRKGNVNAFSKPLFDGKSLRAQDLELSDEVLEKLYEFKQKGLDINQILLSFFDKREEEIEQEKNKIVQEMNSTQSRYIPAKTRAILRKEHGTKCSIQTCPRPAQELHHTQTFALSRRHDPHFLAPLCKEHHLIAHSINIKVQEKRQEAIM